MLILIILSFILGIYYYPQLPEQIASHWNSQNQVDDYMPKFWGTFLMPILLIGLFLLFIFLPKIDPLKKNIEKFKPYYEWLIVLIIAFLFYIYLLTLIWNLGFIFNLGQLMIPALGLLFIYMGLILDKTKQNWFIGIRTPWTLSNKKVWEKTHKLGGKLFITAGIIALIGIFFPRYSIWFVLVPVIFVAIYTMFYSYFEYQKQIKKH